MATTKSKTPTTKKTEEESQKSITVIAPSLLDPFLPVGYTASVEGFTATYAGVIAGVTYLKTVTGNAGLQSETLLKLEGSPQIVPSNIKGFYKVI